MPVKFSNGLTSLPLTLFTPLETSPRLRCLHAFTRIRHRKPLINKRLHEHETVTAENKRTNEL